MKYNVTKYEHWINLARQYIAADLNSHNFGCSFPFPTFTVKDTFYDSNIALSDCTGDNPEWSILTNILDDWNNGVYPDGPSHCK